MIDFGLYCTNKWLSYLHRWLVKLDDRLEPFRGHEILLEVDNRELISAPGRGNHILTKVGLEDRDLTAAPVSDNYILIEVGLDDR